MTKYAKFIDEVPTREEALKLLQSSGSDVMALLYTADMIREKYCGEELHICTLTNAKSGKCSENCKFCAQSSHYDTNCSEYPMLSVEKIEEEYKRAVESGAEHFDIVASGRDLKKGTIEFETIIKFLEGKKGEELKFCISAGNIGEEEGEILKKAGLSRYHNNIQTAPSKYRELVATTHKIEDRISAIKAAKEAGLEVCCGGIIGLGESEEDRVEMAFALKELNVDSIPVNILTPIKGTPLEESSRVNIVDVLKTIALFRIVLKDRVIKVAAGREKLMKDFMGTLFMAGANGMLVGGYLTINGREIEEDRKFIKNIEEIWKKKLK